MRSSAAAMFAARSDVAASFTTFGPPRVTGGTSIGHAKHMSSTKLWDLTILIDPSAVSYSHLENVYDYHPSIFFAMQGVRRHMHTRQSIAGQVDTGFEASLGKEYPWIPPPDVSPISGLPDELLAIIFEATVSPSRCPDPPLFSRSECELVAKAYRRHKRFSKWAPNSQDCTAMFDRGLSGGREDWRRLLRREALAPVLLSHVSRRWRAVALDIPSLWDTISGYAHKAVPLFLEHSAARPLAIHIDFATTHIRGEGRGNCDDYTTWYRSPLSLDVLEGMMELLIPHAARWRSFHFGATEWDQLYYILDNLPSGAQLPQLVELLLYHPPDLYRSYHEAAFYYDEVRTDAQPLFPDGPPPNLRSLYLQDAPVDCECLSSIEGLTTLGIYRLKDEVKPTWKVFGDALRRSPALRSLILRSSGMDGNAEDILDDSDPRTLDGRLQLAELEELRLGCESHCDELVELLDLLDLPSLSLLQLDIYSDDSPQFASFLVRGCLPMLAHLQVLEIDHLYTAETDDIRGLYAVAYNLQRLQLSSQAADEGWLHELGGAICPRLQILSAQEGISPDDLQDCLEERAKAGFRLHVLRIYECTQEDDESGDYYDWDWVEDVADTFQCIYREWQAKEAWANEAFEVEERDSFRTAQRMCAGSAVTSRQ